MNAGLVRKLDDRNWSVTGEVSLESIGSLLAQSGTMLQGGQERLVDFAGVRRIDSAGVALLLEWLREAQRRKVTLRYRNVPRQLLSIAEVCGVRDLLPVEV